MKRIITSAAVVAAGATGASAGGVERSTQSVGILFEEGRYLELSFGHFSPDVRGSVASPFGTLRSDDMLSSYNTFSLGYKMPVGESMDFALVLDQPIGADVDYPSGAIYPLAGTTAELPAYALTGLLRYRMPNNVSLIGGVRLQSAEGTVNILAPAFGLANYELNTSREYDLGYVVGIAWEKPEIAARIALTYNSAITHDLSSTETGLAPVAIESSFETEVPQSVNLEFQTGIAKDTLLFGSIRWAEWSAFDIAPDGYVAAVGSPLVSYASDRVTYNLGIGRRFTETWAGAITLGYEEQDNETTGNLGPTDGFASIGLAATYTKDNIEVTGGIRYVDIGDASTTIGADFEDNSGVGFGLRVGYTF
jgi:long-subunit fatty acid transport protein